MTPTATTMMLMITEYFVLIVSYIKNEYLSTITNSMAISVATHPSNTTTPKSSLLPRQKDPLKKYMKHCINQNLFRRVDAGRCIRYTKYC